MEKSSFGQRFRIAFGNARYAQIADKIGVSEAAVKNYAAGRVPDAEKLEKISELTNCSLHWLLTGRGPQNVSSAAGSIGVGGKLLDKLRTIAHEQAHIVYGDADIAGANAEERTFEFLTEFLLVRALADYSLVDERDYLSAADLKRAQRFTFASNTQQTLDDRIRELVGQEIIKRRQEMLPDEVGPITPARFMPARHMGTANAEEELPSSQRKRKTK